MKKKNLLLLSILFIVFFIAGCSKQEKNLADEYNKLDENNVFVYRNADEIIKILEHGTGIVFLGFPQCSWCQAYAPMLNDVAETEGLEKIYYYDILLDRKDNTETYKKLVTILEDYLQYDDEGNKRIYVPSVVAISKGEIVGFDDETSYDTHGYDKPEDYWTTEETTDLTNKLTDMINQILDNKCTECNK